MFWGVVIVYISVSDGSLVFQQADPRVSQKYASATASQDGEEGQDDTL